MEALMEEVKKTLIDGLQLEDLKPEDINVDAPLFGDDIGLDSVDALELVVEVERVFGVQIEDNDESRAILTSVRTLAEHIQANR